MLWEYKCSFIIKYFPHISECLVSTRLVSLLNMAAMAGVIECILAQGTDTSCIDIVGESELLNEKDVTKQKLSFVYIFFNF